MWAPFLRFLAITALLFRVVTGVPSLAIRRDIADHRGNWAGKIVSYSSNLALTAGSTVTDANLVWLAEKGYNDMIAQYARDCPGGQYPPGAMVVFAPVGENKIYMGSSVRRATGTAVDYYTRQELKDYLVKCGGHRSEGSCGEFNVLQSYFDMKPAQCAVPKDSRIAAWVKGALTPPCPRNSDGSGCEQMVAAFGIKAIVGISGAEPTALQFTAENERNQWTPTGKRDLQC